MDKFRYWEEIEGEDGEVVYQLMFTPFYDNEVQLYFKVCSADCSSDGICVEWTSDILGVYSDYMFVDTLEEAKLSLEANLESHFEGNIDYYTCLLNKWRGIDS